MPQPRIGIKAVAAAAGVSPTTVSHALNGKGRVPEATRQRIRRIAEELGYRPSATARNLLGGRTGLLGLVMPASSEVLFPTADVAYFVHLTTAATRVAMARGYAMVVTTVATDGRSPFERVQIDGAIVVDPVENDPLVQELRATGIPVVTTGRVLGLDDVPWVDNDHRGGIRQVLNHLARAGARAPALVTSQPDTSFAHDIEIEYRRWCEQHAADPAIVRARLDPSTDAASAAARAVFERHPGCDAVFATLDRLALATLHEARARGIAVPHDLLLVGATDSEAAHWAIPSLTVLNLQPELLGASASEMLIDLVEEGGVGRPTVTVGTKLIARGSTRRRPAPRSVPGRS